MSVVTILRWIKHRIFLPNYLLYNFFGNAQFPQSFGQFAGNSAGTVRFQKISTSENLVKLRYITQAASIRELTNGQRAWMVSVVSG